MMVQHDPDLISSIDICEAIGRIKWHHIPDVTNSRSIFVIHSNFLYIVLMTS